MPDCKASRAFRKGHCDENSIWPAGLETQKWRWSFSPSALRAFRLYTLRAPVMLGYLHTWISVIKFSCVTWRSRMSCVREGFLWGLKVLALNPQRVNPDGIV